MTSTIRSRKLKLTNSPTRSAARLALCAAAVTLASLQVHAAPVKAPPLPPGSSQVRIHGGMNPDEVKREARAHHHKGHVKKDIAKDDSVAGNNGNGNGNGQANNPGSK